jgi:hypothetical protein
MIDLRVKDVLTTEYGLSNCLFLATRKALLYGAGNRVRCVDLDSQRSSLLDL